ncbi:hypothetical protein [Ferrimonas balearica]|uniref:hypothetical protein n=1 Tax=Ferrimonas balearica TaxID=44012 RepID=UPI001C99D649|nr:hypothetical protein [Ferrimonas balearica]MBY5990506.1 hypothetical protein [Ferrimonas balearica]
METLIWILLLGLILLATKWSLQGAMRLFAFAAEQGFIGLVVYIACWISAFPFMLTACLICGLCRVPEPD